MKYIYYKQPEKLYYKQPEKLYYEQSEKLYYKQSENLYDKQYYSIYYKHRSCSRSCKGKVGSLPSHQLLWFLASIYLDPGFEPLISQRWGSKFHPLVHHVSTCFLNNDPLNKSKTKCSNIKRLELHF